MNGPRILRVLAATATLAFLLPSATTLASCMIPPPIDEAFESAEIVFVGTVTETSNRGTWASVAVEEVWKGPDQPIAVVIRGGPGGNAATSVDRTFEIGVKYLFFPYADSEIGLADNSCSLTTPWSDDLVALRPADAHQPLGTSETETGVWFDVGGFVGPLGVALLVGGVLLVAGLLARGRQSS